MNFDFEKISFEIISYSGEAKGYAMEAIQLAKQQKFVEANELLEKAIVSTGQASNVHMDVICAEADGQQIPFKMLFMHAEDQLLTTQTLITLAAEIVELYRNKQ